MRPRRDKFIYRPVLAVVDGIGVTELGEPIVDLAAYAATAPASIWVTIDTATLLTTLIDTYGEMRAFNYQLIESEEVEEEAVSHSSARLVRFGFKCRCSKEDKAQHGCTCGNPPKRKDAMHVVWNPVEMGRDPKGYMDDYTPKDLLRFGCDVRDWCQEQDIPLPTSLAGIAAGLLKDARFWPYERGRVPRATNENVRKYLPGVYSALYATPGRAHRALALDQERAYHHAAQDVPAPDPTTLFARGFYIDPENSPLWCTPGDTVYERTVSQPGVVVLQYDARPARKHEFRPPWVNPGIHRAAVYTNEIEYAEEQGVRIEGIIAAWTSSNADSGLPEYGKWAVARIDDATRDNPYRARWLKPTLHSAYGLLAMRPRRVTVGHLRGVGAPRKFILGSGREFTIPARELPTLTAPTTNVPMLGVLQSEIRTRSLRMASALSAEGMSVLHIHADGIHVEGNELPLIPSGWTVKGRTGLEYIDRVSWLSDQGDTLPGRDERMRVEERRRNAKRLLVAGRTNRVHG